MNRYLVHYYNSGGYRTKLELVTELEIRKDENGKNLTLHRGDEDIGGESEIEALVLETLGYSEDIMVISSDICPMPPIAASPIMKNA